MSNADLVSVIARLFRATFGGGVDPAVTLCPASGNNRVFIAEASSQRAIAKVYYRGPADTCDRQESEWRFLQYAVAAEIGFAPRPLARDDANGVSLMEYLEGSRPTPEQVEDVAVAAAASFLRALNCSQHRHLAGELPEAKEARFNLVRHCALVDQRLARLTFVAGSEIERAAHELVAAMREFWARFQTVLIARLASIGIAPIDRLSREEQCISPADFGFHNCVVTADGRFRFFDFEYAGWDDPAKTVCDFFLAPALPVSMRHWSGFLDGAFGDDGAAIEVRARTLMPVFALKWCCIMLNPFLPVLSGPARFADPVADAEAKKRVQLEKATAMFAKVQALAYGNDGWAAVSSPPARATAFVARGIPR